MVTETPFKTADLGGATLYSQHFRNSPISNPSDPNPTSPGITKSHGVTKTPPGTADFWGRNPVTQANTKIFLRNSPRPKSCKSWGYNNTLDNEAPWRISRFLGSAILSRKHFAKIFSGIYRGPNPTSPGITQSPGAPPATVAILLPQQIPKFPLRNSPRSESHKSWDYDVAWRCENPARNCRFLGLNPVKPDFPEISLRNSSGSESHKPWDYDAALGYENLFQNCRFTGRNPVTPAFPKFSLRNSSGPKSYKHWGYEAARCYGNPAKNHRFSGGIPVIHANTKNFSQKFLQIQIPQVLRLRNCLGLRNALGKQPIFRGRNPVIPSNS